jgi:hypothetical protein
MANPAAIQKPAAIIVAFKVDLQLSGAAAHAAIARAGQRRGSSLWRTVGERHAKVANVPPTRAIRRDNGTWCGFTVPRRERWRHVRPAGCPSWPALTAMQRAIEVARSSSRQTMVRLDVLVPRTPGRARPRARPPPSADARERLRRASVCSHGPAVVRGTDGAHVRSSLTYRPDQRRSPVMTSGCQAFAHQAAPLSRDSIANIGPHKTEQGSRRRDARREDDRAHRRNPGERCQ